MPLKAETLAGPVPDAQLSVNIPRLNAAQTFSGSVTFNGPVMIGSSNFSGNGAGLTNVVARSVAPSALEKLWRMPIPFVTVTNPGNEADVISGIGAVPYKFRVGKFEINNLQYTAFLNAVAADDPGS